jgi:hypothetical protein
MATTEKPAQPAVPLTTQKTGMRGRALIIGALGTAATAFLVTQAEMVQSSLRIGYLQFPPAALGLLLIIIAFSRVVKRIAARWSLSSSDLLVIYCMMLVGAMTSSHGIVQKWIPLLAALNYFSDSTNNWRVLYQEHLPSWLFPTTPHGPVKQPVTVAYFEKLPRGESIPWGDWVVPILSTLCIILLVVFAFLCLAAILRRQWVDNEKLSFPLAQLPLEIAGDEERPAFFSNRLMWLGALLPILIYGVNGLHQLQPSIPAITLRWSLNQFLTTPPWNGVSYTDIVISFSAIGFFFLLPADILFSIWFFFVLTRLEQIAAIAYNMAQPAMPLYPPPLFVGYQTMGAYIVLTGYFFWIARPHFKRVWLAAIGRERGDDADEILPYRVAFWGLAACIVLSALWLWAIGMSPWLALLEIVVFFFITAVVLARSTAEAGMLMTETTFRPIDIYRMFGSVHALGPNNLAALAFFDNLFLRDQRGLLLTGFLDASRLSDGTRVRRRSFAGILLLGVLIALVVAGGLNIYLPYHLGANTMDPWMETQSSIYTYGDYQPYFSPNPPAEITQAWQRPTFFLVGVLVTLFLATMRANFYWWPLHPLGYAIAGSWSTVEFWFPCLLAWIFKATIVRYGGMSVYQKVRPFFLGLILGEFGMAVFYAIVSLVSSWINPLHKFPVPALPWG